MQPAYEDPADRMLKQGLVPDNIDPSDPQIDDPVERARILDLFDLTLFDSHLGQPAGFVLPLQRWSAQAKPGWLSEIWQTRRGHLFLMPGDSPLGFRLPLQSLPHLAPADYPHLVPADPFAERTPLPIRPRIKAAPVASSAERRRVKRQSAGRTSRGAAGGRAACRCARLCRSRCATDACACSCRRSKRSTTISNCSRPSKSTAAELGLPVHVEGYAPPPDPRLNVLKVTPDPGVIEVNIQPAASWREAVDDHAAVSTRTPAPRGSAPTNS